MDNFLGIIGIIVLLQLIIKSTFKDSVEQLHITLSGFHKIPKIILELANITKNNVGSYKELSKEEQDKYIKVYERINSAISCSLTYIRSHNLIHIQKENRSYFHKITDNDRYLIYEELGKLRDDCELYFVLYRKDNGWLRNAMLIGYLLKKEKFTGEKEEVTHLFEFPEALIKRRFFIKGLLKKYKLKDDTIADYIGKDELGYGRGIYVVSYSKEDIEGANFWFKIY